MLHIHRSHRTEALVEGLAELLAEPLGDPMLAERLLVGSRGMERWLGAELAARSPAGVFANVDVTFPAGFVNRLVDDVIGPREQPGVDPWTPDALVWTIAGRLPDAIADDPSVFPAVAHYLRIEGRDTDEGVDDGTGQLAFPVDEEAVARGFVVDRRLLGFAGQTAELFDRYGLHRPEMVRGWARGHDVDGQGRPLGDQRWQAELWRAIAGEQRSATSPPARIAAAIDRLDSGQRLSTEVPPRLLGFGVSTLPPLHLDLLAVVARQREVHLYVPSPSPRLWQLGWDGAGEDVQPGNALLRAAGPVARHAATLVREATSRRGTGLVDVEVGEELPVDALASARPKGTLLARLQEDAATDTPLPDVHDTELADDEDDRSIVFHDGHGAVRQVEALQDELLRRFDADPTLQPRDVVVLTPDLQTYAPLVSAVFADPRGRRPDGRSHDGEPPTIPAAIGDRSVGRGNPIASVLTQLLALVHARASGAEVLDLLSTEPVRARFRISPSELVTIQRWVEETGVAWARDEADRARLGQPRRREHTWAAALDRLVLGVAMADEGDRDIEGVVPYDAIEDRGDLDLLDRLTRFLDVVDGLVELDRERSLAEWAETLAGLLDRATGAADGLPWQEEAERNAHRRHRDRVDRVLGTLERAHDALGRDVEVQALARWLTAALDGAGTSPAGHGTGVVTVAELVPLRAIPFRVVCLLGMDTGTFPRGEMPPGHDLAARDARPGDRDRRTEDRALFLDAIHAAQDALVITYAGRDPVAGREQPPAIPIAELRDAVEAYVGVEGLRRRTIVHPILPTGPAAFDTVRGPVSFDRVRLDAARAMQRDQTRPPPFLADPLPPDDADTDGRMLGLDKLTRVVRDPSQALLDRLRIARPEDVRPFPETEPLTLNPLEKWQFGDALLGVADEVSAGGRSYDEVVAAGLARGRLPAGAVGRFLVRDVAGVARQMAACLDTLGPREVRDVAVDVAGRTIEGKLRLAVGDADGRVQLVETWYGQADGRRHLSAWLRHLVGSIALADDEPRSVVQARKRADIEAFVYPWLPPDHAAHELGRWLELHDRARRERVPFVAKVAWEYAQQRRRAERIAHEQGGIPLEVVEGMDDTDLRTEHGQIAHGRSTVGSCIHAAVANAQGTWGRDDNGGNGRRFPERDKPATRLVFRDVMPWEDLVRRTDVLRCSIDLLRPLVDAVDAGASEAKELCA